ncbi:fumarylacetoacetate hydrolase family protein [Paraburkholderia pallida]|uniref:FAA hydrolase family protein n=1 Tax=Paraburkholderia pallida TaxID=2547399 RepID=A0A4P7CS61_9BURK|nr:fumarylacetoacetate hydrolase family protein [Paraburkholderia pallida]QBQ98725.1 FAA hydrolase family protein [Paraburkholderia pallida]
MKFASVVFKGKPTFGAVVDGQFFDLGGGRLDDGCRDLADLFAMGLVERARKLVERATPDAPAGELVWLPVNPRTDARLFALGWAYRDHQLETGKEAPEHPVFFSKLPQSLVGHEQSIVKPAVSDMFDYEGEIVIVIGKPGRHIAQDAAMEHVAGYTLLMDGSVRDWQKHSITAGKNFDASSSTGPWIVTADEIGEPAKALHLTTRLNGEVMQSAPFEQNVWSVPFLVHYISTFCELRAGDAISTGTPGGVGAKRNPPRFMKAGDVVEVEVSGIGVLRNAVVGERA